MNTMNLDILLGSHTAFHSLYRMEVGILSLYLLLCSTEERKFKSSLKPSK